MHDILTVKKDDLENAKLDGDYIGLLIDRYVELWDAEPDNVLVNFSDDQLSLFMYGNMYNQVQNGGFLQLLFNGYGPYVFGSPLAGALKAWGAASTAHLLESIEERCFEVVTELKDQPILEELSELYAKYPEFTGYDSRFNNNDGLKAVRAFVEANLADFITVI